VANRQLNATVLERVQQLAQQWHELEQATGLVEGGAAAGASRGAPDGLHVLGFARVVLLPAEEGGRRIG
jgi:hypothetical protein